jgi:hypothetical protein
MGVRVELAVRRLLTNVEGLNMHIDDWLDLPAKDDAEKLAKEFLEHCRRPAAEKDYAWIRANPLFCTYKGERWRVVGASRLGDVWLSKQFDRENGYEIRPDVDACSDWSKDA